MRKLQIRFYFSCRHTDAEFTLTYHNSGEMSIGLLVIGFQLSDIAPGRSLLQEIDLKGKIETIGELNDPGSRIQSYAEATISAFSLSVSKSTPKPGPSGG